MAITHTKLKTAVEQLASKVYSGVGIPSSEDAKALSELLNFYTGEQTNLSGTLTNTNNTQLSLFSDTTIRTKLFVQNNDSAKILSIYTDASATEKIYTLATGESISFPISFRESIYIKASAGSLAFTAWEYVIDV